MPLQRPFASFANHSAPLLGAQCRQVETVNPMHSAPLSVGRPNPLLFLKKQAALPAEKRDVAQLLNFAKDSEKDLKDRIPFAELLPSGPEKQGFFSALVEEPDFLAKWQQHAYPRVQAFVDHILPLQPARDSGEGRLLLLTAIAKTSRFGFDCIRESVSLMPKGPEKQAVLRDLATDKWGLCFRRLEYAKAVEDISARDAILDALLRDENERFLIKTRVDSAKAMQEGPKRDEALAYLMETVLDFEHFQAQQNRLKPQEHFGFVVNEAQLRFDLYYARFECIQCFSDLAQRKTLLKEFLSDQCCPTTIKERLKDCSDPKDFALILLLDHAVA